MWQRRGGSCAPEGHRGTHLPLTWCLFQTGSHFSLQLSAAGGGDIGFLIFFLITVFENFIYEHCVTSTSSSNFSLASLANS